MNLDALVSRLETLTTTSPIVIGQVIEAETGGFQIPVDSGTELYTLLSGVASVFPVTMKEQGTAPSIVYTLVSSQVGQIDGYRVTQSDRYVLELRTSDYDTLLTKLSAVKSALDGSSYSIDINDLAFDWENDQERYRCAIDVEFTYLSAAAQTLPAVFVYGIDRSAGESIVDNEVHQRLENAYGLVVVTQDGDMSSLLDSIMTTLLGWQQSADHDDFHYVSGTNLEGVAGLEVWREIYRDAQYIVQA